MVEAQIPLTIGISDRLSFSNFIPGKNEQIIENLKLLIQGKNGGFIYLWGKKGSGKSHLLHASCVEATQRNKKSVYLPLNEINSLGTEIFLSMENQDIVCVDDIYFIEKLADWETGLFNLFNQLQQENKLLIVTSTANPLGSKFELQDLKSRLASGIIYHMQDLEDEEKLMVLKARAQQRGFELSNDVLDYLGSRVARDLISLISWLDKLDEASLISKRKITVPFLRDLLND